MWRLLCALWLGWCLLGSGGASAAPALQVRPGDASLAIHAIAEVLEDPTGQLTLDEVRGRQAGRFQPMGARLSSFGFTASAFWVRFTLDNTTGAPLKRLLVLRTNWLDTIDLYAPGAAPLRLGDTLPFPARDYDTPQFLVDVTVAPGAQTFYLRLASMQAFIAPIELWEPRAFQANDRQWSAYYGMFYGILAVMALYNAFLWTSTRDRNYLAFCAYLLSFFLVSASINGFAYQYFWPGSPRWSNWAHTPFVFLFQVMGLWLSMHFLESRRRMPRMHRLLRGCLLLTLASWALVTVLGNPVVYNAAPVCFIVASTPLMLAAGVRAWALGYRAARLFVLASVTSLAGSVVMALIVSGLVPYSLAQFRAAEFGVLIGVVLLSLALADRIHLLRLQRRAAQSQVVRQQLRGAIQLEKANAQLEKQVHQRTAELARARDAAEQLARTDMLTGVANRRWFQEVAEREFMRCRRYAHPLSVAVFDIDHFKRINDGYGHAAGDQVIQAVARIVQASVREVDFVARIGGEEFALLLPEVHAADALVMAERLREKIAAWHGEAGDRTLRCTASFGISEVEPGDAAFDSVLQRADQAMYVAKEGGRDRVSVLAPLN